MNLLHNAVGWLQTVRKASLSYSAVYSFGGLSVPLQVTPGNVDFAMDAALSVRIENDQQDWIATAADLVLGGKVVPPQRGAVIKIVDPTGAFAGQVFEVQAPDGQTQPYATDSTGQQLRIHTKRIA